MSTIEQPIINTLECPENLRFKGYPDKRLHIPNINYLDPDITLPNGFWETGNVSDKPGEVKLPTNAEIQRFAELGLEVDSLGRPLHPNLKEMISNSAIGVVTGRGFFREWGPNYTADPVIVTKEKRPRIMMIERGDGGGWAFAGGFVDANETALEAAVREAGEEAGTKVRRVVQRHMKRTLRNLWQGEVPELLFDGPVNGEHRRTTAHAWTHTKAYLLRIPRPVKLQPGDDAKNADWPYLDELPNNIHPGHKYIIDTRVIPMLNRK